MRVRVRGALRVTVAGTTAGRDHGAGLMLLLCRRSRRTHAGREDVLCVELFRRWRLGGARVC